MVEGLTPNIKEFTLDFVDQYCQPCLLINITRATVNMKTSKPLPRRYCSFWSGMEFEYLTCSPGDFIIRKFEESLL